MATKLFAMEELDETQVEGVEEMVAPEEGEAAEVGAEVAEDTAAIDENAQSVDEGIGAADSLDEVQEVVEKSLDESEGEGEGLSEVAAEAIAVAVRAICARVGANPKSVYSLYATENFRSPSSRRANTKFALEGVGEFLKDLWAKIKAAISSLWDKIKAFWDKHVSSLGRMVKALESMKAKISAAKGAPTFETVEAPSSLKAIFPVKGGALGISEINDYYAVIKDHVGLNVSGGASFKKLDTVHTNGVTGLVTEVTNILNTMKNNGEVVEIGTTANPAPGGKNYKWTFKAEETSTVGTTTYYKLDVEEEHEDYEDAEKEVMLDNVGKAQLKDLITSAITMAKDMVKQRDKFGKTAKIISDNMNSVAKDLAATTGTTIANKDEAKTAMRNYSMLCSKRAMYESKAASCAMAYLRGVIIFSATCLKHIKKA